MKNMKEQYDHLIEKGEDEHKKFMNEANDYT